MTNALSVPSTSASSGNTTTAIVGDNPTPFGSATLGATTTDALTSGDVTVGDPLDAGNLTEFAVEVWVRWRSTLPAADNNVARGPISNSGGSPQWQLTFITAGSHLSATVIDEGAVTRTSTGSVALLPAQWCHVVLTAQGGNLNIYVNGVLDGTSSAWSTHSVRPIGTTAGSEDLRLIGPTGAGINLDFDELAFYRAGLTAARVLEHYNAGVNRGFPQQNPGERIGAVLDTVSSHAPRSIQLGTRAVIPRYMSGQAPLEECRRAVEAEDVDAALFVSASGMITFLADGHRSSSPYNTIQATFGDGAGELAYTDISTDYSESELINEWNVTRSVSGPTTATTQTASDATSISRYFKRSQSLSDVPTINDTNTAAIATALLAKYKDPLYRITSISFNTIDPNVTEAVLQRELMDKVRILRTPPGGGSRIQQDVFIQRIEIAGSNDGGPWTIRWAVSPL